MSQTHKLETIDRLVLGLYPSPNPYRDFTVDSHKVIHMQDRIILASGSDIRAQLLRNAGLEVEVIPARVDEEAIRAALEMEEAKPRDIADALAEAKAARSAPSTRTRSSSAAIRFSRWVPRSILSPPPQRTPASS